MSVLNKPIDLVGHKYGRLTVMQRLDMTRSGALWACECSCGNTAVRLTSALRKKGFSGGCKECERDVRAAIHVRHAGALGGKTRIYKVWKGMRNRCNNPSDRGWKYYGGKGVKLCEAWNDFTDFRAWALRNGYADNLSIERKNPDGNYEPENCEWITRSENSRRAIQWRRANKARLQGAH